MKEKFIWKAPEHPPLPEPGFSTHEFRCKHGGSWWLAAEPTEEKSPGCDCDKSFLIAVNRAMTEQYGKVCSDISREVSLTEINRRQHANAVKVAIAFHAFTEVMKDVGAVDDEYYCPNCDCCTTEA